MSRSRFLKFLRDLAGLLGLSLFSFRCDNGKLSNSPLGPSDGTSFRGRVAVAPSAVSVVIGGTQTFSASGGTTTTSGVYSWSVSNTAFGSINPSSGAFTAGSTVGSLTVTATDSVGNTGTATVAITTATISITPLNLTIVRGGTQTFTATGGTGTYTWTVNNSTLGTVVSTTGVFTARNTTGSMTVSATDTAGVTGTATVIIVGSALTVIPASYTAYPGESQTIAATGGTGTYSWTTDNSTLGRINASTGVFTAGAAIGNVTITATDTAGNTGSATITVLTTIIALNPVNPTIAQGGSFTFTATGGTGTYTWTLSDTTLGRIISTTGVFTAWYTAGRVTVTATDTAGNTGTTNVTIVPTGLTIAPISLILNVADTYTFETTGGTAPYFYSSSGTTVGDIELHTGIFTAAATGTTTITVTDSAGNTGTALVTVQ